MPKRKEIAKEDYDKNQYSESINLINKIYVFPIFAFLLIIIIASVHWREWFNFWLGVFFIFLGNFLIARLTQYSHYNSQIDIKENVYPSILRCGAGFLEMFFYTFFFVFRQPIFVIGYLVLKSIGLFHIDRNEKKENINYYNIDEPRKNAAAKEGQSVAVLRIALLISLFFSLFCAYLILNSAFQENIIYNKILEIFSKS